MKFTKKAGVIIAGAALLGTSFAALPLEAKTAGALSTIDHENPWTEETSKNSFKITGLKEIGEKTIGSTLTELSSAPTFSNVPDGYVVKAVLTDPYNEVVKLEQSNEGVVTGELPKLDKRGTYTLYYVLLSDENVELAKTETLQIKVVGSSYEFDFPTNQFYIKEDGTRINAFIPEKISANYNFYLPIPNVINGKNGNYVTDGDIKITITGKDGSKLVDYTLGGEPTLSDGASSQIEVTPVVATFDNGEVYNKGDETTTKQYKTLNIKTKDVGVYKITYSYVGNLSDKDEDGKDITSEVTSVYDVQAVALADLDMNNEKVRKLSATFEGTGISASAVVGKEFTVPAPKVTNKVDTSEVIDFRTKMEVVYVNNGREESLDGDTTKRTDISSTFKFTPPAEKTGLYRIYYTVYDVYNNQTIEYCQPLTNVADTERPNIYVVDDYSVEKDAEGKIISAEYDSKKEEVKNGHFDASHKVPTVVDATSFQLKGYGKTDTDDGKTIDYKAAIVIPAVYATDNAKDYAGITLNRKVILSSGTFVANRLSSFDVKTEWEKQHPGKTYPGENKAVVIYLEYEGEYTIEYSAKDDSRYSYAQYTVTVGEAGDERTPNIEDLKVGYTYEQNSEIKFARPTADDDVDRRVKVDTYYYFDDELTDAKLLTTGTHKYSEIKDELAKYKVPDGNSVNAYKGTTEDLDNYYISTDGHNGKLYIVTVSRDYNSRFKNEKADEVEQLVKEDGDVSVVVTAVAPAAQITDTNAVEYNNINEAITESKYTAAGITEDYKGQIGYYSFDKNIFTNVHQHNEVLLPYLNFADKEDETFDVSISVSYLDTTTKTLQAPSYTTTSEVIPTESTVIAGNNIRIVGGRFIPTKVGYYVVTYTARDGAGHLTSVTFQMYAKDTEKPSVLVQGYDEKMEIGESQTFYQAVITDNGDRVNNPSDVIMSMVDYGSDTPSGVNPTKSGFDAKNKTFTPTVKGEYHFKFTYKDEAGNVGESDIIKVSVDDTTKPTISLINTPDSVSFVGAGQTTKYPNLVKEGDSYKSIVLPNFTAEDNAGKQYITYSISIKKDGTEIDVVNGDKAGKNAALSFVPGKTKKGTTVPANGEYEITYTATDRYSNVETLTYKLAVGDVNPPKIEFVSTDDKVNKQNQPSGEYKLGKNGKYILTIDARASAIKATDESNEFADANAKDPNASEPDYSFGQVSVHLSLAGYGEIKGTDNGNGIYTFELEAGDYTLRYSVTDRAGNYASAPYKFTVLENDGGSKTATIVWAVVLSVLALCGLGVAIYFLLRDKKSKKPSKVKNKKDKDDNDEGKLVV